MATDNQLYDYQDRLLAGEVITLAAGEGITIDARGLTTLTAVPATGGTTSISYVDALTASSHNAPTTVTATNTAGTSYTVAWPYYRLSVASAGARFGLV